MAEENNAPVLLKNHEKLGNDNTSGFFFLLLGLIPLFVWWLGHMLFEPESFMGTACMIVGVVIFLAILIMYMINYKATVVYMKQIRNMRFKFTNHATLDDVFDELEPALKHFHGGKVKLTKKADCVLVTYNGVNYQVILNDDATFSVRWQKSVFDKILSFLAQFNDNRDDEVEVEPVGKYKKIRTETPIIAYELQQAFGITADTAARTTSPAAQPLRARDILRNSSPARPVAANATAPENRRAENPTVLDKILKHKIIFVIMIALVGLTVMVASYHRPTPKTVNQFIEQYNEEIKDAVKRNVPQSAVGLYIHDCSLYNVSDRGRGRKYQSINQAFFDTYESNEIVTITFTFYENVNPDILFAVLEASIAAVGDDYETVATSLGILNNNRYVIPVEYNKSIKLQDKSYSISRGYSSQYGNVVFFKIDIPKNVCSHPKSDMISIL